MATQADGMIQIQDQNLNRASVGRKVNTTFKALEEGNLGRRKPLADISQKQNSKNSSIGGKKNASKAAKEKVQSSCRKPLSDISNSGKPCGHQKAAPKKYQDTTRSAIAEEDEEEWHNHEECIKAKKNARDLEFDYLLKDVGLDFSLQLATPLKFPLSRKSKPKSSLKKKYLELEEIEEDSFFTESPPCCPSPESPNLLLEELQSPFLDWKNCTPRFTLKK